MSAVGQIMTFYSYKGGTGRSMALANVACLLSQNETTDGEVLVMDWDLEAPGLHQFFHGRFEDSRDKHGNLPSGQLGLIDFFYEVKIRLEKSETYSEIPDDFFDKLDIQKYFVRLNIPSLVMMPAGRFDDKLYSSRVNGFDWAEFFNNYPTFISKFAEYLRKKFKYILIDSRTGYTDISGICTSIMPEKLVVVFTPNRQSLSGVVELIRRATDYRKQSDDLRPLIVFPLASRIENAERDLQKEWRYGNPNDDVKGFQTQLESVLNDVYHLQSCDLTNYFDEIQLQYVPRYSYGEEIAVLSERAEERLSLARSFENFTERLISSENPWEERKLEIKLTKSEKRLESKTIPARKWSLQMALVLIGFIATIIIAIIGLPSLLTPVLTLTPTITLTATLQPIIANFSTPGTVVYFFDPSLSNSAGFWEGEFYVCAYYISPDYDSYEIAKSPEDCLIGDALGWVQASSVILSISQFPETRTTLVVAGEKQCQDGIDNDIDGFIDFPSDSGCTNRLDDREDIVGNPTPIQAPVNFPSTCRAGPSLEFSTIANIPQGESVEVIRRNDQGDWFYIVWDNDQCWIIAQLLDITVDPTTIPIVSTPILPSVTKTPRAGAGSGAEIIKVSAPSQVSCPSGQICDVSVSVTWQNAVSGNRICVYVQPQETPGQPYFSQFEGTSGQAFIGSAPDNTPFEIIAVSTSSTCGGGSLPSGNSGSATVIRINQ